MSGPEEEKRVNKDHF
ncbi:hypothetical protein JL09_g6676 [Pichia kudriavzevii]|uniref:Uncharacterized protein n=1 Tax=Pichia kudriavzevii TaxID=4909 RepID=A0A099NL93_PICKU|nr:hypothetical protein JL09_g6681 [Pichia kudriavzevii]KGK32717.1 hypothetical protein JL09_g6676 [Pichia kudriavzevii]